MSTNNIITIYFVENYEKMGILSRAVKPKENSYLSK